MTAETELPAYLPYPRFLLKMDISHTAKLLYALLLDRSTLSQKNGWQDSEGRTYIVYPIAEIAEMLDKGCTTIKGALNELDAAGLLERRRAGFSAANRLYVKVPDIPVVQFSDQLTDGKPPLIRAGNRPTDSRKTDPMTVGKPSPNQTNIANALMEKEVAVCMTNFATILNDLAASFEGRNEYISRLCSYPLLILDDFGMERGTEYGLEQVYSVIDSRYRSGKPLIATTNLTLEELQHPQDTPHARIYDRLTSMCAPVRFTGSNFRKETAQEKLERLKQLMKQRKESL